MTAVKNIPETLENQAIFSRHDYISAMSQKYNMTDSQIAYDLQKRLDSGIVIHVGWDKYAVPKRKGLYRYSYSKQSEDIAARLSQEFYNLNFQIFELIQLNEFMNHQLAHNTVFVSVENELQDFVFDSLKSIYPGHVMLRPSLEEYYRYVQDDEIVIGRLPTETPKGHARSWESRIEKILVDVLTDKLISRIVPENEKDAIVTGIFESYLLDEKAIMHYARRKGAYEKIVGMLEKYEVTAI